MSVHKRTSATGRHKAFGEHNVGPAQEGQHGGLPPALPQFGHISRYWDREHHCYSAKLLPGEYYVTTTGEQIATVLGSCVSACVRDRRTGIGGMNHFMLPQDGSKGTSAWGTAVSAATRYGNVAMERLINDILKLGSNRENLEIKLVGGGKVLGASAIDVGARNIEFVRKYVSAEDSRSLARTWATCFPARCSTRPRRDACASRSSTWSITIRCSNASGPTPPCSTKNRSAMTSNYSEVRPLESPSPAQRDASTAAFEFVRELSIGLSESSIELPSFPDVATRVQKVLSEEDASTERVVRVIGADPLLATRVLAMANSAALNPGGRQITELRSAITRLGFDALRAAAISFAVAQLRSAASWRDVQDQLDALWQRSVLVASLCYVIARRVRSVNADTAMLTGLVHGVGRLYILTRSQRHPALSAEPAMYQHIVDDWHGPIAKVLLESWHMAEEIAGAVCAYPDDTRQLRGNAAVLADILQVAVCMADVREDPDQLARLLQPMRAAGRLELTAAAAGTLLGESAEELAALRSALGS